MMSADTIEPVGHLRRPPVTLAEDLGQLGGDGGGQKPAVLTSLGALANVGIGLAQRQCQAVGGGVVSLSNDGGRFPALGHSRSIGPPWQPRLRRRDRVPGAFSVVGALPLVVALADVAGEIGEAIAHGLCCQ